MNAKDGIMDWSQIAGQTSSGKVHNLLGGQPDKDKRSFVMV